MRFVRPVEKTAVLLTASKNFSVCGHSNMYESIWFKLGMTIDIIKCCILILVKVNRRLQVCKKGNTSAPVIVHIFETQFGWNLVYC